MKTKRKIILGIDLILIVGSLFVVAGLVGYARPLVIAPIDGFETNEREVLFSFEKGGVILVDDNLEFSSPREIYAEDNLVVNLKPGVYYWKIGGVLESEVRKLTINSEVDLRLKESKEEGKYEVVNSGNTRLNVDIFNGEGEFIGNIILKVDENDDVVGTKFVGREDE